MKVTKRRATVTPYNIKCKNDAEMALYLQNKCVMIVRHNYI